MEASDITTRASGTQPNSVSKKDLNEKIFSDPFNEIRGLLPMRHMFMISNLPSVPAERMDLVISAVKRLIADADCGHVWWVRIPICTSPSPSPSTGSVVEGKKEGLREYINDEMDISESSTGGENDEIKKDAEQASLYTSTFAVVVLMDTSKSNEAIRVLNNQYLKDDSLIAAAQSIRKKGSVVGSGLGTNDDIGPTTKVKLVVQHLNNLPTDDPKFIQFTRSLLLSPLGVLHSTALLALRYIFDRYSVFSSSAKKRKLSEKDKGEDVGTHLLSVDSFDAMCADVGVVLFDRTCLTDMLSKYEVAHLNQPPSHFTLSCSKLGMTFNGFTKMFEDWSKATPTLALDFLSHLGFDYHLNQNSYISLNEAIESQSMSLWSDVDEILIKYIEEKAGEAGCGAVDLPIDRIGPIVCSENGPFARLKKIPIPALRLRFTFFKIFNQKVSEVLPVTDVDSQSSRYPGLLFSMIIRGR
jgi:hypothetical protein